MAPSLVRSRSSVDEVSDLVPFIVQELIKQMKTPKASHRVKSNVMHTLASLSHVLGSKLGTMFDLMLPEFQIIMNDKQYYDLILDTLAILRRLFKGSEDNFPYYQANYQKI